MSNSFDHVILKLSRFLERDNFKGYDPYDGLNSKFLRFLTFNRKWLRIAVIQFMKRFPINLRHLFGIAKGRNPKAMGLLASAYIELYKQTKDENYLKKVREILEWLMQNRSQGYLGSAWGYNFDWQSAIFYIPKGGPTVVNTAFIANAFLDAYEITKEKNYLDIARSSCDFIMKDLQRTSLQSLAEGKGHPDRIINSSYGTGRAERESTDSITKKNIPSPLMGEGKGEGEMTNSSYCFSYTPIDKSCVHNANLLAAELLARVYSITNEENLLRSVEQSVKFTMSYQNPDGSWYYGLATRQKYIDSFHTGFVLVSLYNLINYIDATDDGRFRPHTLSLQGRQILLKGYEYYKKTFFEDDGLPRYYHNNVYPIDLHCSAQGIITFLRFKDYDKNAVDIAKKIANWAIDNMWDDKKGYFYFQKMKLFTNKIQYLRWPNAWMFLALARLANMP